MATGLGQVSLRASSPIWASESSLARFRETHLTRPNRRTCSQAKDKLFFFSRIQHDDRYVSRNDSYT